MEIVSRKEGAVKANLSERTMDRLHAAGEGPKRIQLTKRRCGYDLEDLEAWIRSRAFNSRAAAVAAGAMLVMPPRTGSRAEQARPRAVTQRTAQQQSRKRGKHAP